VIEGVVGRDGGAGRAGNSGREGAEGTFGVIGFDNAFGAEGCCGAVGFGEIVRDGAAGRGGVGLDFEEIAITPASSPRMSLSSFAFSSSVIRRLPGGGIVPEARTFFVDVDGG